MEASWPCRTRIDPLVWLKEVCNRRRSDIPIADDSHHDRHRARRPACGLQAIFLQPRRSLVMRAMKKYGRRARGGQRQGVIGKRPVAFPQFGIPPCLRRPRRRRRCTPGRAYPPSNFRDELYPALDMSAFASTSAAPCVITTLCTSQLC